MNERASSDVGEAGLNEMRVPRDRLGFHSRKGVKVLDSHLLPLFYASWLSVEALYHS